MSNLSHTQELRNEFASMKCHPYIEMQGEDGDYYNFNLSTNRNYLKCECSTHNLKIINVRWDNYLSLDSHLEGIVEDIYEIIGHYYEGVLK